MAKFKDLGMKHTICEKEQIKFGECLLPFSSRL